MARLFINLGRRDDVSGAAITALVQARLGLELPDDNVAVRGSHTYLTVPVDLAGRMCEALTGAQFGERTVICEPAKKS
jgi:hypothetical protein